MVVVNVVYFSFERTKSKSSFYDSLPGGNWLEPLKNLYQQKLNACEEDEKKGQIARDKENLWEKDRAP